MRGEAKEKNLARLLTQASRAHRNRLGTKLASLGLMAGQEQVLMMLADSGPIGTGELATLLHVRPPTVSKMVSRLGSIGLVERRSPAEGDNRTVLVSLTGAGAATARLVDGVWQETENELLAGFDAKDMRRLRKLLRRAIRNLPGSVETAEASQDMEPTKNPGHSRE